MPEVVYFSRFLPSTDKGGGSRRMMQIAEVLKEVTSEYELISTQLQDRLSKEVMKRIENHCVAASEKEYMFWSEKRRFPACRLGEISREWSRQITDISRLKLVVMDDPIYFIPLFEKLKQFNIPVVGICHNLESLAAEQVAPGFQWSLFSKEIDLLAQCHMVVTISREETFLLNNMGMRPVFFPYFPVVSISTRMLQVREKRTREDKKGILLLGNVLNLQTRQGMEKMINFWERSKLFHKHEKLIVAGYGTEKYLKNTSGNAVAFYGELANDEMDRLVTRVRAVLCYQETGAGSLTRICEMLIAGVPVLANSHAARSYYNMIGVHEFRELAGLPEALQRLDTINGEIPIPSPPDTACLSQKIREMLI